MAVLINQLLLSGVLVANVFFVLFILYSERKNPSFALSWILALLFLPVLGFILYLFFGTNAVIRRKKRLANRKIATLYGQCAAAEGSQNDPYCSEDNDVEIFIAGKDKYRQLICDIEGASSSIHLLYFIIRDDRIGRTIIDLLARKAKQGLAVRVLYDHAGCILTPAGMFRPLIESGAQVERFFPIRFGNYLRINFRNHRKIVIIDGLVGYLGGMNIGDEYMGLRPEHLTWRDTHLRLTGSSVHLLQQRFLADWQFAMGAAAKWSLPDCAAAFPPVRQAGAVKLRIVASGPDHEEEEIKWGFLQLIYAAKRRICIQTPYFVPDESFLEALKIAIFKGVQVTIMIPAQTDNFIAHKVSLSYLGELVDYGAAGYFYQGFLHAKMLIVDEQAVSIGSANMDIRSFSLNFEINAFMYGEIITRRCQAIFEQDLALAEPMNAAEYAGRSVLEKMQEGLFRLAAPLL